MHRGFTFAETLIVGSLFAVAILVSTLLLGSERARTRDAIRIADMTRVASAFALLYAQSASYAEAARGCGQVGQSVSRCTLGTPVAGLPELKDPGRFGYTIFHVPDRENFGVRFRLERGYAQLQAGDHTLTKAGFQ